MTRPFGPYSSDELDVESVLTDDEKQAFLDRFCEMNPHWRGAHVADVLDALYSSDSHLDVTEPFWEENSDGHLIGRPDAGNPAKVIDLCLYCALYINGPQKDMRITWEQGKRLVMRYELARKTMNKEEQQ